MPVSLPAPEAVGCGSRPSAGRCEVSSQEWPWTRCHIASEAVELPWARTYGRENATQNAG